MASVADELIAVLKTVPGVAAVFDTETPPNFAAAKSPALVLQHIVTTPETDIGGNIVYRESRYQVSVRGAVLASVRTVVQSVIDALHGAFTSSVVRCDMESAPAIVRESENPIEFHAPIDFTVQF